MRCVERRHWLPDVTRGQQHYGMPRSLQLHSQCWCRGQQTRYSDLAQDSIRYVQSHQSLPIGKIPVQRISRCQCLLLASSDRPLPPLQSVRGAVGHTFSHRYEAVVQRDKDGNPVNNLTIDTCNLRDEQNMGIYLQGLALKTDTHGQYKRIGEVYGFPISIISEPTVVDGKESVQNRFVVEGHYKYKFNKGFIAMSDTHAACMNFVNALEKIPSIIAQYEERTAKLKADVPTLEGIVSKTWGKEDELKALKSDLAALDRKITAELAPKHDEKDGEEVKWDEQPQLSQRVENPAQSSGPKESMVAEPANMPYYKKRIYGFSPSL